MRDPTSDFSFLCYLQDRGRLVDFLNHKTLFPLRIEFHDYFEWAAARVAHLVEYAAEVVVRAPVSPEDGEVRYFDVTSRDRRRPGTLTVRRARNICVATGLEPHLPPGAVLSDRVWHNSELLPARRTGPALGTARTPCRRPGRRPERRRGRRLPAPQLPRGRGLRGLRQVRLHPRRRQPLRQPDLRPRGRRPLLRRAPRGEAVALRLPPQHQLLGGRHGPDRVAVRGPCTRRRSRAGSGCGCCNVSRLRDVEAGTDDRLA